MVDRPRRLDRPGTVEAAVGLMYLGAAVTAVGALVVLAAWYETEDALQLDIDDGVYGLGLGADGVMRVAVPAGVVYLLVLLAMWVWMARTNGRGAKWARVAATTLGALAVALHTGGLVEDGTTADDAAWLALGLHAAAIVVLLWLPRSSRYYDAVSRARPASHH